MAGPLQALTLLLLTALSPLAAEEGESPTFFFEGGSTPERLYCGQPQGWGGFGVNSGGFGGPGESSEGKERCGFHLPPTVWGAVGESAGAGARFGGEKVKI